MSDLVYYLSVTVIGEGHIMITIAFENQKGGVAKTTTCVNLAIGLHDLRKKIIVIDLDPQASLTNTLIGDQEYEKTIADCFENPVQTKETVIRTDSGIDLIPSSLDLKRYEDKMMIDITKPAHNRLQKVIRSICTDYNYCLVDCGPTVDRLSLNACIAADLIIAPIEPTRKAIISFRDTLDQINFGRENYGSQTEYKVLITKVNRTKNDREIADELKTIFGERTYNTRIRYQSAPVSYADCYGDYVIRNMNSGVGDDYRKFTKEVLINLGE